jgi:hypothetical protein
MTSDRQPKARETKKFKVRGRNGTCGCECVWGRVANAENANDAKQAKDELESAMSSVFERQFRFVCVSLFVQ